MNSKRQKPRNEYMDEGSYKQETSAMNDQKQKRNDLTSAQ